ncbi:unnamed protein product [marine sediment metagenome]|uniref:Uncharacterized protein n=1 Tax=marine sediment metagenome TaxID=412755 RepID=X1JXV8_9ZZZZ
MNLKDKEKTKNETALFPLEKILGTSMSDYTTSVGKSPRDYELIGVHLSAGIYVNKDYLKKFQEAIPKNAEMVVDYRFFCASGPRSIFSGTALIPK